LLAGATLLLWGGLTGHALLGLIGAILLEARSWVNLRWDFKHASYIRAWQLSILCGAFIGILAWMNGLKLGQFHVLFAWSPLILLPLELTQRYGNSRNIPLNTFSFFARKKMERDIRLGRSTSPRMINTGYPYIAVTVLAMAMASENDLYHFIGIFIVIGACLYCYMRNNGFRPWAWASAFLIVLSLSYIAQWGMFKVYHYYMGNQGSETGQHTSATESRTSIGKLGRLKLSPRIFWRMKVIEGDAPKLLRTANYNRYSRASWLHEFNTDEYRDDEDYLDPTDISVTQDTNIYSFKEKVDLAKNSNIRLLGELNESVKANPIPLPHFTLAVGDLEIEASIDCNSLGTVRMHNSDYNVVEYSVWTGEESTTEIPPVAQYDLQIPAFEMASIKRINKQLGIDDKNLTTREKIEKIRSFFNNEFQYTTHLKTPAIDREKRQSAIGIFLETTRAGHCEYFATATALLLRQANVPTRYCVGFSVSERDSSRDEWVMRGKHSHAWCRVWIDDHWEDVDLTPASWESMEAGNTNLWQRKLSDWWQRIREDFLIWRTKATNKTRVMIGISIVVTLLLLWISWRLWQSRQRKTRSKLMRYQRPKNAAITDLHQLEPLVAKKIGPRSEGIPFCQWLSELIELDPSLDKPLCRAIKLHSIIRFDPKGASADQSDELASITTALKKAIKNSSAL